MAITVNVIQFGKDTPIEVPEGTTYGELADKVPNGKNLDLRVGGRPVTERRGEPVRDGDRLTAAPRAVKQGS